MAAKATPTAGFPTVKVRDVLAHFAGKILGAFQNLPDQRAEAMDVKDVAAMRFQLSVLRKDVAAMTKLFDDNLIAIQAMSDDNDPIQKIETIIDRKAKRGRPKTVKEINPLEDF